MCPACGNRCHKMNHFGKCCKSVALDKRSHNINTATLNNAEVLVEKESDMSSDDKYIYMNTDNDKKINANVNLRIEGKMIKVDTGYC